MERIMRRYHADFIALAATIGLAWVPVATLAADPAKEEPSRVEQTKQDIKTGARQAGNEIKETAREAGHAVKEGAREAGHAVKEAANEAKPEAKSAWEEFKLAAADAGRSVKTFFRRLVD
jgi:hypothetical protein